MCGQNRDDSNRRGKRSQLLWKLNCRVLISNFISVLRHTRFLTSGCTKVSKRLRDSAEYTVDEEILSRLSPYRTKHINRFGSYKLRFDQIPLPIEPELGLKL